MTKYQHQKGAVDYAHPFVDFIWSEIKQRRLSHTDVAKEAKVDPRSMRRWRDGDAVPSLDALERILDVLGFELVVRPHGEKRVETSQ